MNDTVKAEKTSNLGMDFLLAIPYIFISALRGVKFLCFDMWSLMSSNASYNKVKAQAKVSLENSSSSELELYNRTHKAKAVKHYEYSQAQLAKYEKMKEELSRQLQTNGSIRSKKPNYYQYIVRDVKGNGKILTEVMLVKIV